METLIQDIRFGARQLRRTPAFAVVVVLTLALGIGANTAIFSVMNAVLLRYLPVQDPQRLVFLHASEQPHRSSQTGYDMASMSYPVFDELRKQTDVFSDLMAFVPLSTEKTAVRFGASAEEAQADEVSGNFFSGLGVAMARGRGFTLEDEANHAPIVVLSYSYWTRRFGRNPSVLGQAMYVKGIPMTVVGVAAPGFIGLERSKAVDLWVPLQSDPRLKPWGAPADEKDSGLTTNPKWWYLMEIGRLAPGITAEQALVRLQPVFHQAEYIGIGEPEKGEKVPDLFFTPARGIEGVSSDYKQPLLALMAMVGLVLVIACGNVAMLLVARNLARQREFSLRLALGGSRVRLFRQLLTESLLLVAAGGVLGWVFTVWATRALAAWSTLQVSLAPDRSVLLFTAGISLIAAIVFGLAPLRTATRMPMGLALKTSSANASQDRSKLRSGQVVVALQMSLCLMLLVGALLVLRTLRNLQTANLGMNTSGLVVFGVNPPQSARALPDVQHFYAALTERLRVLPGVESVTLMQNRLGAGWSNNTGAYVDGANPLGTKFAPMRWNAVGSDYFHVLQTAILMGRDFNDGDTAASPKVAIVNQTFVKKYLANTSPLGHTVGMSKKEGATIVGVVADSKYTEVRESPRPMAWFPYTQLDSLAGMHYELRTGGDAGTVLALARRTVQDFGPDLPLMEPMTQEEQFDMSISQDKLVARLSSFFGILAVLLVATGLYGTLAYRVNRRTSEIGVRMALGAQRTQVLWMVLKESLVLCAVGAAIGLPLSLAAARLLRSMLYQMSPGDPLSFAAALAGVAGVALLAGLIPARRASSVDPMIALRYE